MNLPKRIAVLVHEHETNPFWIRYILWTLCKIWKEQGIEIHVLRGCRQTVSTDLIIPHIDVTKLPNKYVTFLDGYPRVVNRKVLDISKTAISENLIRPGDGYDGPVIVKTNRNSGGGPDKRLRRRLDIWLPRGLLSRLAQKRRHGATSLLSAKTLNSHKYPIFASPREVPPGVFKNEALVVERFLPEKDGDLYCLRNYTFFGNQHVCSLKKSPGPIVKAASAVYRAEVPVHDEIIAARERLGFDYGKFDYVINKGKVVLFDVNRTPAFAASVLTETQQQAVQRLASGLQWWTRCR